MLRLHVKKKYVAQGFVEALIAVVVAGIASVILMGIAMRTLRQVTRNEIEDKVTFEGEKGREILNYVVDAYNVKGQTFGDLFPLNPSGDLGVCVSLDGDIDNPELSSKTSPACTYSPVTGIRPADCIHSGGLNESIVDDAGDIFRIACVSNTSSSNLLVAKIFTGFTNCSTHSQYTYSVTGVRNDCKVYEYTAVYDITR